MKITKKELQNLIKESIFDSMRRGLAGTFNIESMKDTPRDPLNPMERSAVFIAKTNEHNGAIYLYEKILPNKQVDKKNCGEFCNLIGFLKFSKTREPCIPTTVEVKFIAVTSAYKNKGYGSLLYGLMFQHAKDMGVGVTSDHTSSTSDDAKAFWDRLPYTSGYQKRKTQIYGNDEFDYYNKTEDPNDDCSTGGIMGLGGIATDNSWEVTHDNFKSHMNALLTAHDAHMDYLVSMSKHKNSLAMKKIIERQIRFEFSKEAVTIFASVY